MHLISHPSPPPILNKIVLTQIEQIYSKIRQLIHKTIRWEGTTGQLRNIESLTNLIRFLMFSPGFIMYFYYGIKHSSLEEANAPENVDDGVIGGGMAGNIELTVTDHQQVQQKLYVTPDRSIYEGQQLDAFGQPVFGSTNFGGTPNQQQQQQQQPRQQAADRIDQTTSNLFIDQESFPTWDD